MMENKWKDDLNPAQTEHTDALLAQLQALETWAEKHPFRVLLIRYRKRVRRFLARFSKMADRSYIESLYEMPSRSIEREDLRCFTEAWTKNHNNEMPMDKWQRQFWSDPRR